MASSHVVSKSLIATVLSGLVLALSAQVPDSLPTFWSWLNNSVAPLLSLSSSEEPPISDLFVLFLVMFVLMGLTPLFDKFFTRIYKYLQTRGQLESFDRGRGRENQENEPPVSDREPELYDFDVIILRSLARAGWSGLSEKKIADKLHLEPAFVRQRLLSLQAGGLVLSLNLAILGSRFNLSGKGREYAKRQGFQDGF